MSVIVLIIFVLFVACLVFGLATVLVDSDDSRVAAVVSFLICLFALGSGLVVIDRILGIHTKQTQYALPSAEQALIISESRPDTKIMAAHSVGMAINNAASQGLRFVELSPSIADQNVLLLEQLGYEITNVPNGMVRIDW